MQSFYSGRQQSVKEAKYLLEYDPYIINQIFFVKISAQFIIDSHKKIFIKNHIKVDYLIKNSLKIAF